MWDRVYEKGWISSTKVVVIWFLFWITTFISFATADQSVHDITEEICRNHIILAEFVTSDEGYNMDCIYTLITMDFMLI